MSKRLKDNPTIEDFKILETDECFYIEWNEIKRVLGYKRNLEFLKFMRGQTVTDLGVFTCDLQNFLRKPSQRFFD